MREDTAAVAKRVPLLTEVTTTGWITRAIGVQPALLMCAAVVAGVGALSFVWGRRVPELMRTGVRRE